MNTRPELAVPETLEGWAVLHQIFHVDWPAWNRESAEARRTAEKEAVAFLREVFKPGEGHGACFSLLGHKGDLFLLHFRKTFDELNGVELGLQKLALSRFLKLSDSYVSVLELGLYEMTVKLQRELLAQGLAPDSEEWQAKWRESVAVERNKMDGRLHPAIPPDRYMCFYPMDKKRGETKNWYEIPIERRQMMMRDHGMIGRKYSGRVTQIITGSIGFDDWEWGVYLFAADPVVFKKLVYEMRFDEASAAYAVFGPFVTGLQFAPENLPEFLSGKSPK